MGYRAPLSDASSSDHGPDGKLDIYLSNLGNDGLYGYCTSDDPGLNTPGTFTGPPTAWSTTTTRRGSSGTTPRFRT